MPAGAHAQRNLVGRVVGVHVRWATQVSAAGSVAGSGSSTLVPAPAWMAATLSTGAFAHDTVSKVKASTTKRA